MRTIHKYKLPPLAAGTRWTDVLMPQGAKIVHAEHTAADWTVWAEVDDAMPLVPRTFTVFGTGWAMPGVAYTEDLVHVVTIVRGAFVWHLYEVRDTIG